MDSFFFFFPIFHPKRWFRLQIKTQSKENLQLLPKINIDKLASIYNRATDFQRDPNAGGQLAIVIIPSLSIFGPLFLEIIKIQREFNII